MSAAGSHHAPPVNRSPFSSFQTSPSGARPRTRTWPSWTPCRWSAAHRYEDRIYGDVQLAARRFLRPEPFGLDRLVDGREPKSRG